MKIKFENGVTVEVDDHATDADIDEIYSQVSVQGKPESSIGDSVPQALKDAFGGVESVARMVPNLPSMAYGAGLDLIGKFAVPKNLQSDYNQLAAEEASKFPQVHPLTESGAVADEMLGQAFKTTVRAPGAAVGGVLSGNGQTGAQQQMDDPTAVLPNITEAAGNIAGLVAGAKALPKQVAEVKNFKLRSDKSVDPKESAIIAESNALKEQESAKQNLDKPIEYDPGFKEGSFTSEKPDLVIPEVDFPLQGRATALYERMKRDPEKPLTTEEEFYNILKEEEQKLGPDVDTSEVRNPYLQGDVKANVEVDSVSGRPIFPDDVLSLDKIDSNRHPGQETAGIYKLGEEGYRLNIDYIARLWLKLSDEVKQQFKLRSAEDLQNFVEMHERQHWNDYKETGKQIPGKLSVGENEARINKYVTEQRDPLIADDSVGVARLPENFREPYDGAPRQLPELSRTPAQMRANLEKLKLEHESVIAKLKEAEETGRETDVGRLQVKRMVLENLIENHENSIEVGREKFGFDFKPKNKKETGAKSKKATSSEEVPERLNETFSTYLEQAYQLFRNKGESGAVASQNAARFVSGYLETLKEWTESGRGTDGKPQTIKHIKDEITRLEKQRASELKGGVDNVESVLAIKFLNDVLKSRETTKGTLEGFRKKEGGAVNFGFAEKVVDTAKKLLNKDPSIKQFAEKLERSVDDPVVAQLYEKYYGNVTKSLTPEEIAISRIPGMDDKVISPDLKSIEEMLPRWATESDVSGNPVNTALRDNLGAGGRHNARRTGNSYIDYSVENVLNTTKRAQVTIKNEQSGIIAEFNKLTKTPLLSKFKNEKKNSVFSDTMSELMRVQDKKEIPNIPEAGKAFANKLTTALETVGRLVEAEFKELGLPFKWRTNYIAHSFQGPFRVLVRDKAGEVIGVIAGKTADERALAMEYVKEKHPDVEFSVPQYNRAFDNAGTQYGKRYAVGSEIMNSLADTSEVASQLKETLSEFYAEANKDYYGYTKHSREMKGVFGYEGGKGWKSIENNMKDALEAQLGVIDHAYHWLAEQKLRKDFKKIEDSGVLKNLPEAAEYVNLYLDHAFGRLTDKAAFVDDMIGWAAEVTGVSGAAAKEALAIARNFALVNSLSSIGNVTANLVQAVTHPQIAIAAAVGKGIKGDPLIAQALGWIDATHILKGDFQKLSPDGKIYYKYMKSVGSADPHLIEHTISRKVFPTTGMGVIKKSIFETINGVFKVAEKESEVLGKLVLEYPEAGTRTTTILSLAHYYKSAGMSTKAAIIQADKDLSIFFTDYSSQERAMMFQKMGEIGKFSGTVTTYKLNSYNQVATLAGTGNVAGLAAVAAVMWATGGLVGMPFMDEAEYAVNSLRSGDMYPDDWMSPKEYFLTKADIVSMGAIAELTGINGKPKMALQRKFGNENAIPDTIPDFIYPLHSFWTNKAKTTARLSRVPTQENAGAALREWSPALLKQLVDRFMLTSKETGTTMDANKIGKDDQSGFKFTSDEWKAKILLGIPTMREYKASQVKNLNRVAQEAWKTRSESLIEAALEHYQAGHLDKFNELLAQAVKYNATAAQTIKNKLEDRSFSRTIDPEMANELTITKQATTPHGAKGLQQFQKMQRNN